MLTVFKKYKKINKAIQAFTSMVFLHLIYLVGIGVPSLLAKMIRKPFLNLSPKNSTWQKHSKVKNLDTMY